MKYKILVNAIIYWTSCRFVKKAKGVKRLHLILKTCQRYVNVMWLRHVVSCFTVLDLSQEDCWKLRARWNLVTLIPKLRYTFKLRLSRMHFVWSLMFGAAWRLMQFSSVDLRPVIRSMEIACQHSPSLSRRPGDSRCDIHVNCRYSK